MLNDHFGTSFTNYVPVEIPLYNIGDYFPNWAKYEKIRISYLKVAAIIGEQTYSIGQIDNSEFSLMCKTLEEFWIVGSSGEIKGVSSGIESFVENIWKPKLQKYGYKMDSYNLIIQEFEVGNKIDDWNSYVKIE